MWEADLAGSQEGKREVRVKGVWLPCAVDTPAHTCEHPLSSRGFPSRELFQAYTCEFSFL